ERAEPANLDVVPVRERATHRVEEAIHSIRNVFLREPRTFRDLVDDVGLGHVQTSAQPSAFVPGNPRPGSRRQPRACAESVNQFLRKTLAERRGAGPRWAGPFEGPALDPGRPCGRGLSPS